MKKLIMAIGLFMFLSPIVFAATYDGASGRVIGTRDQHATSGVTVGPGDCLVCDDIDVVGDLRAATVTSSAGFIDTSNDYAVSAGTHTWHKVFISTYMADTADYDIAITSNVAGGGWLKVIGHSANIDFSFSATADVYQSSGTVANSATDAPAGSSVTNGTDGLLNVYDDGVHISIDQQLGASYLIFGEIYYKD